MKISKSLRNTFLKLMAVVMVFTTLTAVPATQANAAANKALKITAAFDGYTITENGRSKNTYYVDALYTKKQVKLSKNMTMQATVYLPASLLSGVNNQFHLFTNIIMCDNMWKTVGIIGDKTNYSIMVYNDGHTVKASSTGSNRVSVKKSGKYYKVTLKIPMNSKYYYNGKLKTIKANKAYNVALEVEVMGSQMNGKGTIYVDDLKINSKPGVSMNFSKKDFAATSFTGTGKKVKVSAAKIK